MRAISIEEASSCWGPSSFFITGSGAVPSLSAIVIRQPISIVPSVQPFVKTTIFLISIFHEYMIDTVVTCYVKTFLNNCGPCQHVMLKVADPPPIFFKICVSWQQVLLKITGTTKISMLWLVRLKVAYPKICMPWQLAGLKVAFPKICMPWQLTELKVPYPWRFRWWLCRTKDKRKPTKKRIVRATYSGPKETRNESKNASYLHCPHFPIIHSKTWLILFLTGNKDRFCLPAQDKLMLKDSIDTRDTHFRYPVCNYKFLI